MNSKLFLGLLPLLFSLSLRAQWSFDSSTSVSGNPGLYSIVISSKGRIVYQRYFNGHRAEELYNNQSLTKSIVSLLIGIAIDKGFIPSADERILPYFPALGKDPDPRKRQVTIREIMNQASGLWHENLDSIPEYLAMADPSDYVVAQPMLADPGQVFHYDNAATHLLSVILTEGLYQGKRIVSREWVHAILEPQQTYATAWGFEGSRYGLCYYHFTYAGRAITYGMGWGGQFLIIVPDEGIVITVNENPDNRSAVHQSVLFTSRVFPLIWKDLAARHPGEKQL
jgi:CubicO group peptidase (beta-lactamase class C family)